MRAYDETYAIQMDGDWSLEDLYVFPRTFEQVYFLMYSFSADLEEEQLEKIMHAYRVFPWRGGYSAVDFYNQLKYIAPEWVRPNIVSIEYSSPGALELGLLVHIATNVSFLVAAVAGSILSINKVYNDIIRGMSDRKLMRIKIEEAQILKETSNARFIEQSAEAMAHALGFKNISEINERTGNPYRTLKILLSAYRRVRTLAEYQNKGKVSLPTTSQVQQEQEPPLMTDE